MFWRWKKTRESAGVGCKLHSLRHFYASGLIAAGVDVVAVQKALGHHSASITLNTYSHLWPDSEDRTRAAVDSVLRDPSRVKHVSRPASDGALSEV